MSAPLRRVVRVACPISRAFEVFTSRIDAWWPQSHRRFARSLLCLEPAVGGRLFERSEAGEEADLGEVLCCEPPYRISYTWYPGAKTGPTEVDVRFTDEGAHTLVEVTHTEGRSALGDEWPERAKRFAKSWDEVLPAFVAFTNKREDDERV